MRFITSTNTIVTINILPGNGDGTFGFPEISHQEPTNGNSTGWLGVGDFDGDGNPDVAFESFINCGLGSTSCQASAGLHTLRKSSTRAVL